MTSVPRILARVFTLVAAVSCLLAAHAGSARAEYPERPIRVIVPFPPGGAVDVVARLLTARMAQDLGWTFVVENKSGAGGIPATEATAKATADGYTVLLTTPSHTINAALKPQLPYDPEKDLLPVSIVAEVSELLVSHPAAPFDSFAGFVAYAKANPGKLNYSSAGNGTLPHVTMELLLRRTGIQVTHVPYRGAAPAMADLLSGQVQLKLDTYATANASVSAGKLRALAYASRTRSALMPDLPTVAELGLPGYEGILWIGMMVPAGTPKEIVDKPAAACARAVRGQELSERLRRTRLGVRGVRFLSSARGGALPTISERLAARAFEQGWHVQFYPHGADISDFTDRLLGLPNTIVLDHFASVAAERGVDQPAFKTVLRMLDTGRVWIKLSGPMRCMPGDYPYAAVTPMAAFRACSSR